MSHPLLIVELKETCNRSPTQWEGVLDDSRPIYIRYRWGRLEVNIGPPGGDVNSAIDTVPWFKRQLGHDLDGFIELSEVCTQAGLVLAPGLR